jgi:hypothetical protein
MNSIIFHEWLVTTPADLVKQIDENGGWPVAAKSLVMMHSTETRRPCYFSIVEDIRDEWNTSVMTADEYYWMKVSDARKSKFATEEIKKAVKRMLDDLNIT